MNAIQYRETRSFPTEGVLELYRANGWSAAEKPREPLAALAGSHSLATGWDGDRLIGLGNAISDGRAVEFYRKCGFERAGQTVPMWIYAGRDH